MSGKRQGMVILSVAVVLALGTGGLVTNAVGTESAAERPAGAQAPTPSGRPNTVPWEVRILAPDPAQVKILTRQVDLLERRDGPDFFALGDVTTVNRLRELGLRARLERRMPYAATGAGVSALASTDANGYATFYGGYHTVEAHEKHLKDVRKAHPDLAKIVTFGKSWLAEQGKGGHSLKAICITELRSGDCTLSPSAPKPRSVVVAAMHARELATAEIAWNWIDYLTSSYGEDSRVTSLLRSTEIWVVPQANPDGSRIVESGGSEPILQRKNGNDADGNGCASPPTAYEQGGVDLNRNFSFEWSGQGSSTEPCDQVYHGTGAASEPETQALEGLFRSLFADRRGESSTDAAPADTTGTIVSYHSYGGMVLYPWGHLGTPAPNRDKLAELAGKMASFNNYKTGAPSDILYSVSGSFDDFTYGELGVATFTTELGPSSGSCDGFTPSYSCVSSVFWPQEKQALLVLAEAAAGPYR